MTERIIKQSCIKLGLKDPLIAKKAEEYFRILQGKTSFKAINDGAKIIMCIDLACTTLGFAIDKELAFKLSGLRKVAYQKDLNSIEKILNIDKPKTVSELCVRLQCMDVRESAENLLSNYKEYDNKIKDIDHPQYAAVSVLVASTFKGIKIDKTKLMEFSHLKKKEWTKLVEEFEKFAHSIGFKPQKAKGKHKKENEEEQVEKSLVCSRKKKIEEENEVEDYEVWKERILKEAENELINGK